MRKVTRLAPVLPGASLVVYFRGELAPDRTRRTLRTIFFVNRLHVLFRGEAAEVLHELLAVIRGTRDVAFGDRFADNVGIERLSHNVSFRLVWVDALLSNEYAVLVRHSLQAFN